MARRAGRRRDHHTDGDCNVSGPLARLLEFTTPERVGSARDRVICNALRLGEGGPQARSRRGGMRKLQVQSAWTPGHGHSLPGVRLEALKLRTPCEVAD